MGRESIFDYEGELQGAVNRIEEADIHKRNKELILNFKDFCFAQGLSEGRVTKYINHLKNVSKLLGMPLDETDKDNIVELVGET